ncbi:hypothetical protein BLS_000864 [Venturia inaequalis]|uniref:HMG box domain-containing protein n=1 Tax=Venturia inaequalis TaxID=5025 RepID=A0A8H3VCE9_VENIN|nr:hypothetical protein BLS_000864 [Venturia inaequalis]KAE9987332.1 hypothetical protein EG328_003056 [Venturia inaequalis]
MSQNTTISTPASITKVSGSKDIAAHPSLHPTIRLSKRNQPELSIASVVPLDTNNERLYSLANVSETLQSIPARMTRKRTADTAYVVEEEEQPHKSGAASKPEDNPQPSIETIEKICLCQPDPKIPRPRNAFILYRQRHQQSIVAQHPRLPNPEISKIAGELWRAEPDHVKSEWKSLADEEKSRHAQQYPDYRFQPRHKSKSVAASTASDRIRCSKCGGRSIIATGPPFPLPGIALQATAGALKTDSLSTTSVAPQSSGIMSTFHPHPRGLTIDPNRTDPRFHHPSPSPTMRRLADDSNDHAQESKRARYDGWNPTLANRSESVRTSNTGHQPLPQRRTPPSLNSQLLMHDPTDPGNSRRMSEMMHIPSLLTPGAPDESRSVEAMVMSIPFFNKLKVIRQVARRIDDSYLSTPGHHIRGTILAIEGDDPQAVDGVMTSLSDILQRSGEFDVRCMSGPAAPSSSQGECDFKDYMSEILQWHEKSKHIIDFVTGVEYTRNETPTQATAGGAMPVVKHEYMTLDDQEMDTSTYSSPSDTETPSAASATSRKDSQETLRERMRAASVASAGMGQLRECTPNTAASSNNLHSENYSKSHKIPLLLINNHILHATNVWSSSIPITDSYSPVDQWRWFASLWRGIVGADVTVYIKAFGNGGAAGGGNANNGGSVIGGGGGSGEADAKKTTCKTPAVEIKEEFGTIIVRQDGERVDDSAVRRVGFEVGEWVRKIALGAGERG